MREGSDRHAYFPEDPVKRWRTPPPTSRGCGRETSRSPATCTARRSAGYDRPVRSPPDGIARGGASMPSPIEVRDWHELDVVSADGRSVGKLIDVYVNNETGEPEFLLVASGFLHNRLHIAPAEGATRSEDTVALGVTKEA